MGTGGCTCQEYFDKDGKKQRYPDPNCPFHRGS